VLPTQIFVGKLMLLSLNAAFTWQFWILCPEYILQNFIKLRKYMKSYTSSGCSWFIRRCCF